MPCATHCACRWGARSNCQKFYTAGLVGANRTIPGLWRLSSTCFLLLNTLLFCSRSMVDWLICFFFVRVAYCPAALSTRFCTWLRQIRTLRRPSCAVLPILRYQNTSSWRRRVLMHVVSDILPGRDLKLTFLSVTNMYVHTYIARIDTSFIIQSLALTNALCNYPIHWPP